MSHGARYKVAIDQTTVALKQVSVGTDGMVALSCHRRGDQRSAGAEAEP
jgi:hypothetical protein